MIHWIESQSTAVNALLVLAFCYALTAAIAAAAIMLARRPVASQLKACSPVTLTPLAVILGLLLAFLSSRVWTNVDRAGEQVGREAGALREVLVLADALPDDARG